MRIAITGAAGLVGQNLVGRLKARGGYEVAAIDRHPADTRLLRRLHPDIRVVEADLAEPGGGWAAALDGAEAVVIAHAQIGGSAERDFHRNNVLATERLLEAVAARGGCRLVHVSSSAVNSAAANPYTETKKAQERLVLAPGNPCVVLRPTLMFGRFDRKHLGWLARFMRRAPVFPVPGHGRYPRQPLYAGDFCCVVESCLERWPNGDRHDISGRERIGNIDLVRLVRDACRVRTPIVKVPYRLFRAALRAYALLDRNPPFTTKQLEALVTPDLFAVADWPRVFDVRPTPLRKAMDITFRDLRHAPVAAAA